MIAFKELGKKGRFANQLFQISSTIGTGVKLGHSYGFPKWPYQKYFKNPLPKSKIWPGAQYQEPTFHYNEINVQDNTNLSGYFQSEKYFKHCEDLIRYYFEFDPGLAEKIKAKFAYILKENTCAIHVRRKDYVTNLNHSALPYDYYLRAIKLFNDVKFIVFSDDTNWCNKMFRDGFLIIKNNSDIEDFILMSFCNHFIIANSSFSWWSAWLSKSEGKKVIAPLEWFGPGLKHYITKDLYPAGWHII